MTLDELLKLADAWRSRRVYGEDVADRIVEAVIDMLGEAQPCGYPEPIVYDGLLTVGAGRVTPTELRALCAMWLRACDEAEGG